MSTLRNFKLLAISVLALGTVGTTHAGEPIDLGNGLNLDWRLSTTYTASVRMKNPDRLLAADPTTNDGNNNFKKGAMTSNRFAALFEGTLSKDSSGFVLSASTFYDDVYHRSNDNTGLVNKRGAVNKFTSEAKHYHGGYSRILDAYAYTSFDLGQSSRATVRLGRHAVNWGEALYFPNIAMAQGPFDGTKTGVPGTETKDSILSEDQISGSIDIGSKWSILGQVQFNFHPTLAAAPGSFMSTSDGVGPGASCMGPYYFDYCTFGARRSDIKPGRTGQWAIGTRYRVTDETEVGLYYMNYHDRTPLPEINFADRNYAGSYRIRYFDNIKLLGATVSTSFGAVSTYGELSYRKGAPVLVGDNGTPTRSDITQLNLGGFYNIGRTAFADSALLLAEVSGVNVRRIKPRADIGLGGNPSDNPFFQTKNGLAISGTLVLEYPGIAEGWDMSVPISYSQQLKGRTLLGGVGGQGDKRYSVGVDFTYKDNLSIGLTYLGNIGKASLDPKTERLETDRDQLSLTLNYIF